MFMYYYLLIFKNPEATKTICIKNKFISQCNLGLKGKTLKSTGLAINLNFLI